VVFTINSTWLPSAVWDEKNRRRSPVPLYC